jgi:uncharacterized protein
MQEYRYLIAPVISWVIAQTIKASFSSNKKQLAQRIFQSGDMPSAHAAFVSSLATVIALNLGVGSVAFSIAAVLAVIVVHDSVGVRRTVGEHTSVVLELARNSKQKMTNKIHLANGHNLAEAFAGVVLGIVVGLVINYIL